MQYFQNHSNYYLLFIAIAIAIVIVTLECNIISRYGKTLNIFSLRVFIVVLKIYRLFSHIFRPEFMKYNSSYTRAVSLIV